MGLKLRLCSTCNHTETSFSNPIDHNYENGICTACGSKSQNLLNYKGKVISILGDSISTFAGYIPTADGFNLEHLSRYPQDNLLTDVNETWWMQVINTLDAKLGINDSWRGSMVSGYASVTSGSTGANAAMSNLQRIKNLGANGNPDVILFYGGTNDYAHLSVLGTFTPETAPKSVDLETASWNNLADAYIQTLLRLQYYYPNAEIVALLPTYTTSYYSNEKLEKGNTLLAEICQHYSITYLDLRNCGITSAELPDGIHPSAKGMDYIADMVVDVLLKNGNVISGENVVYSIKHNLTDVTASLGYYKGVSQGASFKETLIATNISVTITMGEKDITDECYIDGEINIPVVTGNVVVTASGEFSADGHLQKFSKQPCSNINIWTILEHDEQYFMDGTRWGVHASGNVYSVTFLVNPGDKIFATSFGKAGQNGGSINGIRVTFFGTNGVTKVLVPDETYLEFSQNGYLTAPEGTVAVNIPMWNNSDDNEVYLLNYDHTYENGICTACGVEEK